MFQVYVKSGDNPEVAMGPPLASKADADAFIAAQQASYNPRYAAIVISYRVASLSFL